MSKLSAALVAAALPAAAALSFELVRFAPAEGSEVERTATWTETTTATDVMISLGGEETSEVPTVFTSFERELSIESKEQFVRSGDGRPIELVRRFGPITMEASADIELELPTGGAELSIEGEGACDLEEIGVRFVWDDEAEEWVRSYADDYEGREELLEELRPTTDFLALLPEDEEVEEGDTWDVDADALFDVLRPGGTLPLDVETDLQALDGVLDPLMLPGVFDCLVGEADGKIEATVEKVEDGVVVIAIDVEVDVRSDQKEAGGIDLEPALPDGAEAELTSADYLTKIRGEGALAWDVAAGRMASFRFEADVEVEIEMDVDVSADGQDLEFSLRESREGRITLTVE